MILCQRQNTDKILTINRSATDWGPYRIALVLEKCQVSILVGWRCLLCIWLFLSATVFCSRDPYTARWMNVAVNGITQVAPAIDKLSADIANGEIAYIIYYRGA